MTDTPEATLRAYIRAFETLDPEAALPFYHLPSMFIAPQGVFAAPDAGTVRALLAQFMGQLRAQTYRHTNVSDLEVRARCHPSSHPAPACSCASMPAVKKSRGLASPTPCETAVDRGRLSSQPCMTRLRRSAG
jgi:hypothetical protein